MKTAKLTLVLAVGLALLAFAAPASAEFSITNFNVESTSSLAGAHPDVTTDVVFGTETSKSKWTLDGNVRELFIETPPGMVGDPSATAKCTQLQYATGTCPATAEVGTALLTLTDERLGGRSFSVPVLPVYNMVPRTPEETAELAFSLGGIVTVHLPIDVRTDSDYGLTAINIGINRNYGLAEVALTTWGVPADPIHDSERTDMGFNPVSLPEPRVLAPFYTNPTSCGGPLEFHARATSYQEYGTMAEASETQPPITGCDELEFKPTLKARPTTNAADAPSGLDVDLAMTQNEDPDGRATSALRDSVVTLPEGLVINPSSANGLDACTPAQIGMTTAVGDPKAHFNRAVPSCPTGSSLGMAEVETPAFDDPLKGSVYLASPHQNPFGSLIALYLVVEGHGLVIKLPGKVDVDPQTGRLSTSFVENPQQPVSHLRLSLFSGAVAALRTPSTCGKYATTSVMTPWSAPDSGPPAEPKDEYEISQGPGGKPCGAPENTPSFEAGSTAPLAGAYKPFVVNLRREDGTQQFSSISVSPPPGLVAKLAGTQACSDAAIASAATKSGAQEKASPSCPASSAVGSVYAAAGAGPTPYNAPGTAYLAGPYKGAPLSLAIITPATAGPFDLGTIVVRTALYLDSKTAQVKAVSDPIPSILQGIPLDVRSVSIRLDRPSFTLNPTSCDPTKVEGSVLSLTGSTATVQSRFQLAECGRLKFKPSLALSLKGDTKRGGHPALTAVLKARPGDANISGIQVALPRSEFLAQNHIRTVCTRVQFAAGACPARSVYGKVTVTTPLLDEPLSGPVYLRSSDNTLPDLVPDLHGPPSRPIHFEAAGKTDSVKGGIRNTFSFVPDVPFTKLTLRLQSGKKGLLENSRDICASTNKADVSFTAHNGEVLRTNPPLKAKCGAKAKKKGKRSGKKHG
jgi:hypothetical protein